MELTQAYDNGIAYLKVDNSHVMNLFEFLYVFNRNHNMNRYFTPKLLGLVKYQFEEATKDMGRTMVVLKMKFRQKYKLRSDLVKKFVKPKNVLDEFQHEKYELCFGVLFPKSLFTGIWGIFRLQHLEVFTCFVSPAFKFDR